MSLVSVTNVNIGVSPVGRPRVSILIPVYNREHLVRRSIESALAQTESDIELVVADNCSTDGTYEVIQEYAHKDHRIRCHRNERNIGAVANWLRCTELSRGQYTNILFSDDWMEPKAIESLLRPLEGRPDVGFAYSSVWAHPTGSTPRIMWARPKCGPFSSMDLLWDHVTTGRSGIAPYTPVGALFRRSDVLSTLSLEIPNRFGLNCSDYGIGNDALMLWRCCERYPFVYHVRQPLFHLTEPEVDEPSVTWHLERSGHGEKLSLCYHIAFANFLANSTLSPDMKRSLHTAMLLVLLRLSPPVRFPSVLVQFSRLFPGKYRWWELQPDARVLGFVATRFVSIVRRLTTRS